MAYQLLKDRMVEFRMLTRQKNYAKILFRNSETRGGAEIKIEWKNKNLTNI